MTPGTPEGLPDFWESADLKARARYAEAEPLYRRALAIREQALGPDHPHTANCLNNLALLYSGQGQYAAAEPLYRRALAIAEQALGSDHPDTATCLNSLALLYSGQGQYAAAEPLYRRALAIREQALGPDHPHTANCLNNLAGLYPCPGAVRGGRAALSPGAGDLRAGVGPRPPPHGHLPQQPGGAL